MAQTKGRGWHGDSQGHANAGRKGGQARQSQARTDKSSKSSKIGQPERDSSMKDTSQSESGRGMGSGYSKDDSSY